MNSLTVHIIAEKFIEHGLPTLTLAEQANLLGISRASLYYQPKSTDPETLDLMHRIDKIHTDWPVYGSRKIAAQLTRDLDSIIGRKRVRSLMEEMGIAAVYPKPRLSLNGKEHPVFPYLLTGVVLTAPNQVWGADITYIKLHGGYLYLVAFLDWYSRFVVSWELSNTLDVQFCLDAAAQALANATPGIMNVDQGVQFTSADFIGLWNPQSTKISMDHRGRCFDNIFTERFWRSLKYEEVYLKDYRTVPEARRGIGDYINRYNHERLHEALGYKTPAEVYFSDPLLRDSYRRRVIS
jgi:putative transposase